VWSAWLGLVVAQATGWPVDLCEQANLVVIGTVQARSSRLVEMLG
jgi:hypothetical protein